MKKSVLLLSFSLFSAVFCFSQDFGPPPKPADPNPIPADPNPIPKKVQTPFWSWDRVYVGGALGLQFGTFTLVNIAPDFGYKITERYSAGVGIRYIYLADNTVTPSATMSIYGASVFNRFYLTKFLFAHAEYEVLNGPWTYYNDQRSFLTNVWVGGGISQRSGGVALNLMALWNLNDTPNNPFPNPQIRVGIGIGL